ncbi:hypothetical protein R3X27_12610 [Tropicimonas sp. TH_r6]|uniref:hypothetical protein n=1 Tax=Tropicimonas sp. TH_r6 TaxID=3082085 RepID=UPI002953F425|nr:hypothetical protein [Tropicimonas sp. TH_r6]MDV7143522.1 hypothetical protein [Tropicimonas sp. TH_r6]
MTDIENSIAQAAHYARMAKTDNSIGHPKLAWALINTLSLCTEEIKDEGLCDAVELVELHLNRIYPQGLWAVV